MRVQAEPVELAFARTGGVDVAAPCPVTGGEPPAQEASRAPNMKAAKNELRILRFLDELRVEKLLQVCE